MKKIFKAVMLAVLGVAMVFGGMALLNLNVDANTGSTCSVSIRPLHSGHGSATKTCTLTRAGDTATARTFAPNGQLRTHVFFMQQPNGVPVTVAMNPNANRDTGWRDHPGLPGFGLGDSVSNGEAGINQQVQARHWFRRGTNYAAYITHTFHR